jgi:hypothetical protein
LKNSDEYAKFCEEEDAKHWLDCWQSRTRGSSYMGHISTNRLTRWCLMKDAESCKFLS